MICPGSIKTEIRQHSEEILEGVVDMQRGISMSKELMDLLIPAGRFGTTDEVAALGAWLLLELARIAHYRRSAAGLDPQAHLIVDELSALGHGALHLYSTAHRLDRT